MTKRVFGEIDGETIYEVTLRSATGVEAKIISWGAVVRDLVVPVRTEMQRVVLGLDTLADYVAHSPHFGAIAGRYANRIAGGTFKLEGETIALPRNERDVNTLHGGKTGFSRRPWQLAWHDERAAALTLLSPDGDNGFPGNATITCIYRLEEPATLSIELTATTDAPTLMNLAHHSYFNLDGSETILDHQLQIDAPFITPVNDDLIPTGEILAVAGTPYNFTALRPIRLPGPDGQPIRYDHNFVLAGPRGELRRVATVHSAKTGLSMEVHTTEPGLQFYSGGKLALKVPGHAGRVYGPHAGLCLEPGLFPDSPNKPHFPDPTLYPGDIYRQVSEYRFVSGLTPM
jgi:aldose 1-epimerase